MGDRGCGCVRCQGEATRRDRKPIPDDWHPLIPAIASNPLVIKTSVVDRSGIAWSFDNSRFLSAFVCIRCLAWARRKSANASDQTQTKSLECEAITKPLSDTLIARKPPLFGNAPVVRPVRGLHDSPHSAVLRKFPSNAKKPAMRSGLILSVKQAREPPRTCLRGCPKS